MILQSLAKETRREAGKENPRHLKKSRIGRRVRGCFAHLHHSDPFSSHYVVLYSQPRDCLAALKSRRDPPSLHIRAVRTSPGRRVASASSSIVASTVSASAASSSLTCQCECAHLPLTSPLVRLSAGSLLCSQQLLTG